MRTYEQSFSEISGEEHHNEIATTGYLRQQLAFKMLELRTMPVKQEEQEMSGKGWRGRGGRLPRKMRIARKALGRIWIYRISSPWTSITFTRTRRLITSLRTSRDRSGSGHRFRTLANLICKRSFPNPQSLSESQHRNSRSWNHSPKNSKRIHTKSGASTKRRVSTTGRQKPNA